MYVAVRMNCVHTAQTSVRVSNDKELFDKLDMEWLVFRVEFLPNEDGWAQAMLTQRVDPRRERLARIMGEKE